MNLSFFLLLPPPPPDLFPWYLVFVSPVSRPFLSTAFLSPLFLDLFLTYAQKIFLVWVQKVDYIEK